MKHKHTAVKHNLEIVGAFDTIHYKLPLSLVYRLIKSGNVADAVLPPIFKRSVKPRRF